MKVYTVPPVLEQLYEERTPPRHWPVLKARVSDVRTLPEQRLRISLTDLHLQQPDDQTLTRLPGNLAWTWEQAAVFPLPGQTVRLQRKLLPVDTQRNFGLTDWGFWWHSHVPVACAMQLGKNFKQTVWYAVGLNVLFMIIGLFAAFYLGLKPGGTIVLVGVAALLIIFIGKRIVFGKQE